VPPDLPDATLAAATEREVRLALEPRWRFLTSRSATIYLNKVLRQVAKKADGAPDDARVILFEDPALRTLALPSGTILISQGTLDELEDEAQLAFLLAHELVHASSGQAAARLVRLGFQAVAHEGETQDETGWADAAEDVVRLGHGEQREHEADARALDTILALDYDPRSVVHYLQNVEQLVEQGDERVAELALSHPPAGARLRRIERLLHERVDTGGPRQVNREVFRRAARDHAETSESVSLRALSPSSKNEADSSFLDRWIARLPWIGIAAFLLLLLALVFGALF
jgi:predicted Zn-dependent protease